MNQEIRSVPTDLKVIERDDTTQAKQIQGYAILFNQESSDLGGFTEVIEPTALNGVDLSKVQLIYGHEHNSILARADSGNLTLSVDDSGLFFVATLADTTVANNVYADILAGNLKGMSFGFTIPINGDTWNRDTQGNVLHTINQIGILGELTVTPNPAYSETSVEVKRSLDQINRKVKRDTMNIDPKQLANLIAKSLAAQTEPADDKQDKPATEAQRDDDSVEDLPDDGDSTDDGGSDDSDEPEERSEYAQEEDKHNKGKDTKDTPEDDTDATTASEDVSDDKGSEEQTDGESQDEPEDANEKNKAQERNLTMPQVAKNKQVNERSNFHNFLKRDLASITDGTVAADNSVALPNDILKPIEKPANTNSLIALANITSVNAPSGDIPVLGATNVTLNTVAELQANPQLAKMQLETISYKLSVKRGFLPISQELLDHADTVVGIDQLIGDYASQIRDNTLVAGIASVLKQADTVTASSFDDVKVAYNSLFKYNNKAIVATKSAFDTLDTLKDNEGRYLLTDSITSPSSKSLLGAPVYVVEDTVLGSKDGDKVMFVGDIKSFAIFPTYKDLRVKWTDSDIYGQKLQLVLENDNVLAQKEAGKLVTLNFAAPAAPSDKG